MRSGHRWSTAIVSVLTVITLGLVSALPASAHAELEASKPRDGQILKLSPARISLRFDEAVSITGTSLRVIDVNGKVRSRPATRSGAVVSAALPAVGAGRYVMAWSVVSDDGHRITGARAFGVKVGNPRATPVSARWRASTGGTKIVSVSGARVGSRVITLPVKALDGRVDLTRAGIPGALSWPITGRTAKGMLPFPGTYRITVHARVSTFDELVLTGSLVVRR